MVETRTRQKQIRSGKTDAADERLHWSLPALADTETLPQPPDIVVPAHQPAAARTSGRDRPSVAVIVSWLQRQLDVEARYGTGFVLLPVAFGLGAVFYFALPVEPALHNIPLALVVAVLLLALAWHKQAHPAFVRLLAAAAVMAAGMAAGQVRTHMLATPMVGSEVATTLTGRVVTVERRASGTVRYTIDVIRTERPHLRYAPDRVRVTARSEEAVFRSGDGIEGRLRLSSPSGPFRPGGFDFAFHNYFAGIGANGFFYGAPRPAALAPDDRFGAAILRAFRNLRMDLGMRVNSASGGGAGGAVSSALITGDKAPIPEDVSGALRMSGLAHILTISGLHMALVAGAVMIVVRAGLALFPDFAARRSTRKIAACWALGFVAVYLFLAGASVATQRSFIMLSVMLGALLLDQAAITMRNLAIAALIVMMIAPEAVTGPSFQMSFAATAALIATYAAVSARADKRRDRFDPARRAMFFGIPVTIGKYALGLAITAIVAGAATGLYSGYHFNRIAPYGLIANVLAVPIVSLVTMPLAVVGVLAIPFGLDGFVLSAMAWSVERVIAIAQMVVGISPSGAIGVMPKSAMLAGSAGLLVICLLRSRLRWLALVPFAISAGLMVRHDTPAALITEDARQFGVLTVDEAGQTHLAVNRSRPNGFTLEQWQPAYRYQALAKPEEVELLDHGTGTGRHDHMICDEAACLIDLRAKGQAGARLTYLKQAPVNAAAVATLCASSRVIIHAYAPSNRVCSKTIVEITAQALALRGSAAIYLDTEITGPEYAAITVRHAIGPNLRPWHEHRQFSRSARNLAPWKPKPRSQ